MFQLHAPPDDTQKNRVRGRLAPTARNSLFDHGTPMSEKTGWKDDLRGKFGAGDRIRTGDIDLGKVALYQLSYSRPDETTPESAQHPILSRRAQGKVKSRE
jgi:hypothetical protein